MEIPKTLLHGTDARILSMSAEERNEMREACVSVSDTLFEYYEPLLEYHFGRGFGFQGIQAFMHKFLEEDGKFTWYHNLKDKLTCWSSRKNGSPLYQYEADVTYLTIVESFACDFSWRARFFGEVGAIAHTLYYGYTKIFPKDFLKGVIDEEAVRKVEDFANGTPQPIIIQIPYSDLQPQLLEYEHGLRVGDYLFANNLRYRGSLDLNKFPQMSMDDFIKENDVRDPYAFLRK